MKINSLNNYTKNELKEIIINLLLEIENGSSINDILADYEYLQEIYDKYIIKILGEENE